MQKWLRPLVYKGVRDIVSVLGFEVVDRSAWRDSLIQQFAPFEEIISEANKRDLPVGEYMDLMYNEPGATQLAFDQLVSFGVMQDRIRAVCEIGPGAGRFLERTIALCRPDRYEIYETAKQWGEYLVQKYGVILRPTDGKSLSHTADASVDLVHAHRVFVATPFLTTYQYFQEMIRVTRPGGYIVFDIITEDCMTTDIVERWVARGIARSSYPWMMAYQYTVDLFMRNGFELVASFLGPLKPGKSEIFIFKRSDNKIQSG